MVGMDALCSLGWISVVDLLILKATINQYSFDKTFLIVPSVYITCVDKN